MAVRKRGKNWYVDYSFGGKRYWITVGPRKSEALDLEAKIRSDIRAGTFNIIKDMPFGELVEKYLNTTQKRSIGTEKHLLAPAIAHFGNRPTGSITPYDVEAYRAKRIGTPTVNKKPRSNATCNREISALNRVFNKAREWRVLRENPVTIKPLEESRGRTRFLTQEQARSLIRCCPGHLRPIVMLAMLTGMRKGEILSLKWDDVDFENRTIYVGITKNGTPRHVPMNSAAKKMLEDQLYFSWGAGNPFVFCHKDGTPYSSIKRSFSSACRAAGITGFRFHDLRHTAASHMAMGGVPLRTIGEILGHRTETMTERYSHLSGDHKQGAVESLSCLAEE